MKKLFFYIKILVVVFFVQPCFAQQEINPDIGKTVKIDSLLDTYSIEEIIKFRDFYQQKIDELEKDKLELREKGIVDAEKFVANNHESKVLDRVLMRLAELHFEKSNEIFLKQMQEYERLLEESDSSHIDVVLKEPKRNYSKPLKIYEFVINKFPHSNLADDAYYNKGYILEEISAADSALQIYNYMINEFPESRYVPESLMRIAEYYFTPPQNQIETAIEYYKKILDYKGSPKFDEALYRLGWSYYRLSNYTEAVSYFTLLVDDIQRVEKIDSGDHFSNPDLKDEALEYIGICFFEHGGISAAVKYLKGLNTPDYGFIILKKLGDVYLEEKEEYDDATMVYSTLLKMYRDHVQAPEINEKIVYCFRLQNNDRLAYLQRDKLFNLYKPESPWWIKHEDKKTRENVYQISERSLRDNITLLFQQADYSNDVDLYNMVVTDCKNYLKAFPTDTSAPRIQWNMALTMDTKLKQYDQAFEEYMKICDIQWNSKYQRFAAENAIALAKDAVELDTTKKVFTDNNNQTLGLVRNERSILSALRFHEMEFTKNEKKLIRAYNNYIKFYPHENKTIRILANAGALYFNNNMFAQALRYFNTIVKQFPDFEGINTIKYQILESYFGKGDYKSAEIVAKRIKKLPDVEPEIANKATRRLAESIFLAAKVYADSADHLQSGNEYLRVVTEVPNIEFGDLSLFNAAWEYDKAKEFSRAVETYNFLIETHPESKFKFDAMNNLAIDYGELEEFKSAALTYEKLSAITGDPTQAHDAQYNSSLFFVKGEYWEDAIRINRAFIEKFSSSEDADDMFFNIATYYFHLDKLDKANQIYVEYIERFPNSPRVVESFFHRGMYYEDKGNFENAVAEYKKAVDKNDGFQQNNLPTNDYFAAEALFQETNIQFDEFREINFALPTAQMEQSKQKKRDLLIEIVDGFTKVASYSTIRLYEATYNIGKAYEEFANAWARQEISPMGRTRHIVAQKDINKATVELYGKAEDSYKQSISILKRLADEYEQSIITSDSTGMPVTELKKIVARDSTLHVARRWIDRCEDKLSRIIYDMADINLTTVNSLLNAPIPEGLSNVAELEYNKQILVRAVTPLINEIVDEHIRNIQEAWKLGIENQWIKLSRKKVITTSKLLADQYHKLAQKALDLYELNIEKYGQLINQTGASAGGKGANTLSDEMASLIDYSKAFTVNATEIYKQTLITASQENIQDPGVSQVKECLFKDLYEITQKSEALALTAYFYKKRYAKLFKDTGKIEYEDALFSYDNNYFSIKENNQELLEQGYQISQDNEINNRWSKRTMLALVEENPKEYNSLLNLKIKNEQLITDLTWQVSEKYVKAWADPEFDNKLWSIPEYVDLTEQINDKEQIPIWMTVTDTIGFTYDTTFVAQSDSNKFVFDVDSLFSNVAKTDSTQIDTNRVEEKKEMLITKYPEIKRAKSSRVYFRKTFDIPGLPVAAEIKLKVDDSYNLFLNSEYIATHIAEDSITSNEYLHNLTDALAQDKNLIAIEVIDSDKTGGGLIARLNISYLPGWEEKKQQIIFETSDKKIKENLTIDKYIIIY